MGKKTGNNNKKPADPAPELKRPKRQQKKPNHLLKRMISSQCNQNKDLAKLMNQFQIRDCCVVMNRVTLIKIELKKDTLIFDDKVVKPTASTSNAVTYNVRSSVQLNKLINDQCNVIKKSSNPFAPKTLAAESDRAWRAAKKKNNAELQIGQLVVAKMRTYSPWPGQIRTFAQNGKRAEIYFFGTDNTGMVDIREIVHSIHAREVMRLLLLRKIALYQKAVRELERICGVSDDSSLLKEMPGISI